MDVLTRLFTEGTFDHIFLRIFSYIDGTSLEQSGLVFKSWRKIAKHIYFRKCPPDSYPSFYQNVTAVEIDDEESGVRVKSGRVFTLGDLYERDNIKTCKIDANNLFMVLGFPNGKVELRSLSSPEHIIDSFAGMTRTEEVTKGHMADVTCVRVVLDYAVTCDRKGKIIVWNIANGTLLQIDAFIKEDLMALNLLNLHGDNNVIVGCNGTEMDLEAARETLINFFSFLNSGDYERAVNLFGGSYTVMQDQNPECSRECW